MMIFPPLPVPLLDAVGIVGFALYVLNYTLLTLRGINADAKLYFAINIAAASCVLIGLTGNFNLAAALVQIFWVVMSTLGLAIRMRRPQL